VPDTKDNAIAGILPLSVGMKVALTVNICTNDGMANGARGILRQIVYDEESAEQSHSHQGKAIVLKKPPKYVVVELIGATPGAYEGLPPNHVPIYPIKRGCVHTIWRRKVQKNFQHSQLPLTPAFAFTDYKCQGRTLEKAVVDLSDDGTSNGVYVMLSRVQRLEDLLILRPFKESTLDTRPPPTLRAKFKRLEECAQKTENLEMWPEDCIAVSS
jgi:hypothetical protein